jgi:hypothetical protein
MLQSAAKRAEARVAHERQFGRASTTKLERLKIGLGQSMPRLGGFCEIGFVPQASKKIWQCRGRAVPGFLAQIALPAQWSATTEMMRRPGGIGPSNSHHKVGKIKTLIWEGNKSPVRLFSYQGLPVGKTNRE